MLVCDICDHAYALYRQHEQVCQLYSQQVNQPPEKPFQICYLCARKLHGVAQRVFSGSVIEEQ